MLVLSASLQMVVVDCWIVDVPDVKDDSTILVTNGGSDGVRL